MNLCKNRNFQQSVILSIAKDLITSTLCIQILRFAQSAFNFSSSFPEG